MKNRLRKVADDYTRSFYSRITAFGFFIGGCVVNGTHLEFWLSVGVLLAIIIGAVFVSSLIRLIAGLPAEETRRV